jgi:hypothetical protein
MRRAFAVLAMFGGLLRADDGRVRLRDDFQQGSLAAWTLPRADDWEIVAEGPNRFLRLRQKGQIGEPRRPLQYALRRDLCLGDFDLRVKMRRAGRSLLVVFGYQDTLHFYYAHLSSDRGDHRVHNGLFKVDGGERFRIAGSGSRPALPDSDWREIRVVREVAAGRMEVYAGGEAEPLFRHVDAAFGFGRIGLGSFDETGDFDDFRVEGRSSRECR